MLRAENVGNIKQQTAENISFARPNVNLLDCRTNPKFLPLCFRPTGCISLAERCLNETAAEQ